MGCFTLLQGIQSAYSMSLLSGQELFLMLLNGPGDLGSIPGRVILSTQKWYLIYPCLILSIMRYLSMVKWVKPGKGVVPSLTPRYSSYWKGNPRVIFESPSTTVTNLTYISCDYVNAHKTEYMCFNQATTFPHLTEPLWNWLINSPT